MFAQVLESIRQASLATLSKFEMPKIVNDETLAAISKAVDTSHITAAFAQAPVFAQVQEAIRQASLATLPRFEMPKIVNDETLAAISKAVDTSHITAAFAQASALRHLGQAFTQHIVSRTDFAQIISDCATIQSVTMQTVFDELLAVSGSLLVEFNIDEGARVAEPMSDSNALEFHATLVLIVVLALTIAAVPGATESIASFSRTLLEEGVFLGRATHDGYVALTEVLPDDNVLG